MSMPVRLIVEGEIGLIEIDHPPVNASAQIVRRGLLDSLERAEADPAIRAIVIAAAGRTFTAGGDITEFGKPALEPHLPDVINRIEDCQKPVVVAWHGTPLGGGCEIGLGAHARIAAPGTEIGLPEVKLGLMPGAGGTQRLPRLIGAVPALEMIATGRSVAAQEALQLGLINRISRDNLRAEACAMAMELVGHPIPRVSREKIPQIESERWQNAVERVQREARGRIAPLKAIELIENAVKLPFSAGQAIERRRFFELMASDQSRALRHLFAAERAVGKVAGLEDAKSGPLVTIGVIGAGTMGSGITVALLEAGLRVILVETSDAAMKAGLERIAALHQRNIASGRLDEAGRIERLARLAPGVELGALASADLVIEAVFEDLDVKRDLFSRLANKMRPETILATNTSYLDLEALASFWRWPENFLGLHFFSPAHVMRLLEVVKAERTSPQTLATGLALAKAMRKIAVVSGVCEGFIGNRILASFRAQCEFMLEEGALPGEIDGAMEAFGLAMGPFAVQDLAGLDIAWARRKRLAPLRKAEERYVPLLDQLCEMGRFGQKAGRGWYLYRDGKRVPDPEIEAMVRAHASRSGQPQKAFSPDNIQKRILAAMINEGAKILAEGIAARPLDIDVVMVHGYGFPGWRGGPMYSADRMGLKAVVAEAMERAAADGPAFTVAPLLLTLLREGRDVASLNNLAG
jgi:3-hydroxyacyl-CoA dehydrogenase